MPKDQRNDDIPELSGISTLDLAETMPLEWLRLIRKTVDEQLYEHTDEDRVASIEQIKEIGKLIDAAILMRCFIEDPEGHLEEENGMIKMWLDEDK